MLKAVLVEDEKNSQELIKALISEYSEGVEVVGIGGSVAEGSSEVEGNSPRIRRRNSVEKMSGVWGIAMEAALVLFSIATNIGSRMYNLQRGAAHVKKDRLHWRWPNGPSSGQRVPPRWSM